MTSFVPGDQLDVVIKLDTLCMTQVGEFGMLRPFLRSMQMSVPLKPKY